jgi:hypothetical protein
LRDAAKKGDTSSVAKLLKNAALKDINEADEVIQ